MCTLILNPSLLNIVHQVFVLLIAVTVYLRAGVTVFVSTVCNFPPKIRRYALELPCYCTSAALFTPLQYVCKALLLVHFLLIEAGIEAVMVILGG